MNDGMGQKLSIGDGVIFIQRGELKFGTINRIYGEEVTLVYTFLDNGIPLDARVSRPADQLTRCLEALDNDGVNIIGDLVIENGVYTREILRPKSV